MGDEVWAFSVRVKLLVHGGGRDRSGSRDLVSCLEFSRTNFSEILSSFLFVIGHANKHSFSSFFNKIKISSLAFFIGNGVVVLDSGREFSDFYGY